VIHAQSRGNAAALVATFLVQLASE